MNQEQLKETLQKHILWLNGKDGGEKADLHGADLRWADLHWVCLASADLRGANLECADLEGANLYWADLRGATLYWADLRGAGLHGAKMYKQDADEAALTQKQRNSIIICD